MGRTVKDTAIVLDAIVGYDPKNPYTAAFAIAGHKGSYTQNLDAGGLKSARIGVLKEAFGSDSDPDCAEVNKVIRAAIKSIAAAGAEVVDVSLSNLMDFILETSLYITHSRHDINAFLGEPGLRLFFARCDLQGRQVPQASRSDKRHHDGAGKSAGRPGILSEACSARCVSACGSQSHCRQPPGRHLLPLLPSSAADAPRIERRPVDGFNLPDQYPDCRADLAAVDLSAGRLFVGGNSRWVGDGCASLSRARSVPARLCFRAIDAAPSAAGLCAGTHIIERLLHGVASSNTAAAQSP